MIVSPVVIKRFELKEAILYYRLCMESIISEFGDFNKMSDDEYFRELSKNLI